MCSLRIFCRNLQVRKTILPEVAPNDSTRIEAAGASEIRLWDPKREVVGDISLFLSMSKEPEVSDEEPEDDDEKPEDDDEESDDGMVDYWGSYEDLTPLWDSVLHQSYPLLKILGQCLVRSFVTSAQFNPNVAIRLIWILCFIFNSTYTTYFTSWSFSTPCQCLHQLIDSALICRKAETMTETSVDFSMPCWRLGSTSFSHPFL